MTSITELQAGQSLTIPLAPIRVRISSTSVEVQARLEVLGAPGGAHLITDTESVVLPRQGTAQLIVNSLRSEGFAPGQMLGLSLHTEGQGPRHQVEIRASNVAGSTSSRLAVLEISSTGVVISATGQQVAPQWLRPGADALLECGVPEEQRVPVSTWALVIDGSASMRALQSHGQLSDLIALIGGVFYQCSGRLPEKVFRTGPAAASDMTSSFADVEPPLDALISGAPAPSSCVLPSVLSASKVAETVVVITDGVPLDVEALTAFAAGHFGSGTRLVIVTTGCSRFCVIDPPTQTWREELAALQGLSTVAGVDVLAIPRAGDDGPPLNLSQASNRASAARLVSMEESR